MRISKTLLTRSAQVLSARRRNRAIDEFSHDRRVRPTRGRSGARALYRTAERWDVSPDVRATSTSRRRRTTRVVRRLGNLERTRRGDVTAALGVYIARSASTPGTRRRAARRAARFARSGRAA
jgi:hypothetical protein